jgi:hypothetical protein
MRNSFFSFIVLLFFSNGTYAQNTPGILRVSAHQNSTGKLQDNWRLDTIYVQIITSGDTVNCLIPSTGDNRNMCKLSGGKYKLVCSIDGITELIVEEVIISPDKITFVDILFEPHQELSKCAKRKRNKLYSNKFL